MSKLLVRAPKGAVDVTPSRARWRYVGFRVARLARNEDLSFDTATTEACIVVLSGTCDVRANDERWSAVGERRSVFDGPPAAVYLPPRMLTAVTARAGGAEVAIASAPAARGARPRLLPPDGARLEVRGSGAMERRIHHILMEDQEAEALLVTEVVTPGGHWSSYPPHKHDEDHSPDEVVLEEIYYYRTDEPEAFGVQRLYSPSRGVDVTATIRDGDLMLVPFGYHTTCAAHGYDLYYLNALAGDRRSMAAADDPELAWIRKAWEGMEKDPRVPLVT